MPGRPVFKWMIGAAVVLIVCGIMWLGVHYATQVQTKSYELSGKVVAVHPDSGTVTVHNNDMPGLMSPMDMDYQVKNKQALSALKPGDAIRATLITDRQSIWELQNVTITQTP
jgi:Cu/Ag efflux protein CusF